MAIENLSLAQKDFNKAIDNDSQQERKKIEELEEIVKQLKHYVRKNDQEKIKTSSFSFLNAASEGSGGSYSYSIRKGTSTKGLFKMYELINKAIIILTGRPETSYIIYLEIGEEIKRLELTSEQIGKVIRKGETALKIQNLTLLQNKFKRNIEKISEEEQALLNQINTLAKEVKGFNQGHAIEALQKCISSGIDKNNKEGIYAAIFSAKNNTPWYTGGDVGSFQIKFVSSKGSPRLTTYNTLTDMVRVLETLIIEDRMTIEEKQKFIKDKFVQDLDTINEETEKWIDKHIQDIFNNNNNKT